MLLAEIENQRKKKEGAALRALQMQTQPSAVCRLQIADCRLQQAVGIK